MLVLALPLLRPIEIAGHLWQHQRLYLRLPAAHGRGGPGRHLAVQLSEVLDPYAVDPASGAASFSAALFEDAAEAAGQAVTVRVDLEASEGPPAVGFELRLRAAEGSSELVARAAREGGRAQGLCVRCCCAELPLQGGEVRHWLPLAETWAEARQALEELDCCLQVPLRGSADCAELPVDLSELARAAGDAARPEAPALAVAEAAASSSVVPSLGEPIVLSASLARCGGASAPAAAEAGATAPELGGGVAFPRLWRISVEVKSIRLLARTANCFVVYAYAPFAQPRPFRTSPPTLARKNETVYLPHSFAAYTRTATAQQMQGWFGEPLRLEVWHRDAYRKDALLGFADATLAAVLAQPVQMSASMPSMVRGFRVVDQACAVLNAGEAGPARAGSLRVLCFLEDLGPADAPAQRRAAADALLQAPGAAPATPRRDAPVDSAVAGAAAADAVGVEPGARGAAAPARPIAPAGSAPASAAAAGAAVGSQPGVRGAAAAPSGRGGAGGAGWGEAEWSAPPAAAPPPEGFTTYELELWRRAEEGKFRALLADEEAAMRGRVEEEFRQRERARAAEFERRKGTIRGIEAEVRRALQDLQRRRAAVAEEEARHSDTVDGAQRAACARVQEAEAAARERDASEQRELELAQGRTRLAEGRAAAVQGSAAAARQRAVDLEAELEDVRRRISAAPAAQARRDLEAVQLKLQEQRLRAGRLQQSRDHFRARAEELCRQLPAAAPAQAAAPPRVAGAAAATGGADLASLAAGSFGIAEALQKIQEELAVLAERWEESPHQPPPLRGSHGAPPALPRSPPTTATGRVGSPPLGWLLAQRQELLQSGLYGEADAVVRAIDAKIAEAR
ncbi:unnamed protein product [Prorocentrum cordatum]|uniref:Centrosomal protein of 120 kDa n=1 Tax=Prorocentrum cordatum TaxID=2364126 RepID=A0ABN9XHA6_9DINO|nr:unnamed protein product [Polarella glacialis]